MNDDKDSMEELAPAIDLDLPKKLRDPDYRHQFFLAESSALIAEQLVALRKRRQLSQKQVADLAGTRQPAISRAEQADYRNWSFNTLRSIADVLDARIRVLIEASEDVLPEYSETPESVVDQNTTSRRDDLPNPENNGSSAWNDFFPAGKQLGTPMNDDLPLDPNIAGQVIRNRIDPREPPAERRIG
jgi:transcriptional regulator with XRE-family HTH domain